jgi:hypothetical protein
MSAMNLTSALTEARQQSRALDQALEDSFPASDPPSLSSPTIDAVPTAEAEQCETAYFVIADSARGKALMQWKTHGQARWVSPDQQVLHLAMSPALALLDALAGHCLRRDEAWSLATVQIPKGLFTTLDPVEDGTRPNAAQPSPTTPAPELRLCCERWAVERNAVALRVPSPLCPGEYNVLLNLMHPHFDDLRVCGLQTINLEPRLLGA